MSDGREFQVCGAATENARRANSVRILAADSSGALEDRRGRTGTAGYIRSCKSTNKPYPVVKNIYYIMDNKSHMGKIMLPGTFVIVIFF